MMVTQTKVADEPTTTETPGITGIKGMPIHQLQSLMSGNKLTPRQLEVLSLVANGLASKQVARKLSIGEQTVKNYMSEIMNRLGANSRAHAVALAYSRGLILL